MKPQSLDALAALMKQERSALLDRWRQQVRELPSAKHLDVPTLNDHVPALLDELANAFALRSGQTISAALSEANPSAHGLQRLRAGFDLAEVVAEYNILRGCIHDLAESRGLSLQGQPFHILNRVLDAAIGVAVETFATQRALDVQARREEYLTFVMHDLRTPLNAISLAARVLEDRVPPDSQSQDVRMVTTLRRNVRHLEQMVAKVIEENSNLQTEIGVKLERRHVDLWPLVEALIHDLHPVAGTSSTELVNDVPDDLSVYADAGLLRRIFQNLIANAINYTPRGRVVIGARHVREDRAVECWVSDNGSGIPVDLLERIFDKFESDPQKEEKSGLGLAIVKTFVEAHGGRITVVSHQGLGATFRFTLPVP